MDNPSPNSWNSVRQVIGPHGLLSVLMPAFNLEKAIAANVRRVHALFAGQVPFEIVVINDGSRDGTAGELRRLQSEIPELHPVLLPRNVGKGAALRAGFEAARGTHIVFLDADLDLPTDHGRGGLRGHAAPRLEREFASHFLGRLQVEEGGGRGGVVEQPDFAVARSDEASRGLDPRHQWPSGPRHTSDPVDLLGEDQARVVVLH